jgi:RNA polymerase sigma factor (sigma-70 family)
VTKGRKDFHVTITLRNNQLLSRRKDLGVSQKVMAETIGISVERYRHLELCRSPLGRDGDWSKHALACAEYWDVPVEELFPEALCALTRNEVAREIDASTFRALALGALDQNERRQLLADEAGPIMLELIKTLPERERKIIERRFGFNGEEMVTHAVIGESLGVHRNRVCQLEAKALRRLRHPRHSKRLKPFVTGRDEIVPVTEAEHGMIDDQMAAARARRAAWMAKEQEKREAERDSQPVPAAVLCTKCSGHGLLRREGFWVVCPECIGLGFRVERIGA